MPDALTIAIIGIAGTVLVALVTVSGNIINARIQARTAQHNRDREDAVRTDERQAEERRRQVERESELERIEQQRLAEATAAQRQVVAQRLAYQREAGATFVAQSQTLYRNLVFASKASTAEPVELGQIGWDVLSQRLGVVMMAFDDEDLNPALAAVEAMQEASIAIGQRAAPDTIARLLATADDYLREFAAIAQARIRDEASAN